MSVTLIIIIGAILLLVLILWLSGERGRLMMPSTKRLIKMAGLKRFFNLNTLHGYIYLRLQKKYLKFLIKGNPFSPPFVRNYFTKRYHSKVLTPDHAKKIINLDIDIHIKKLNR